MVLFGSMLPGQSHAETAELPGISPKAVEVKVYPSPQASHGKDAHNSFLHFKKIF
jgi:hypothetical protein